VIAIWAGVVSPVETSKQAMSEFCKESMSASGRENSSEHHGPTSSPLGLHAT
jgi:hypothetical protein